MNRATLFTLEFARFARGVETPRAPRRSTAIRLGAAALAALLLSMLAPAAAHADDDWLGADKALHFSVSVALAAGGYGAGALVWDERWARATSGATVALTLGATKELLDLAGLGDPSWRDFAWDALGTVTGVALALGIDLLIDALSSDDDVSEAAPPAPRR